MRIVAVIATTLLVLTGCDHNPFASPSRARRESPPLVLSPGAASRGLSPLPPRPTSPEENALIDQIVALYPASAASGIRDALLDPRTISARVSNNKQAQALLDRLNAIRDARADSVAVAAASDGSVESSAAVVAMDRLPVRAATAVVLRRRNAVPHDVIELPSDGLTAGALASAVHALIKSRQSSGAIPPRDELLVIKGAKVPDTWTASGFVRIAQADLGRLAARPLEDVSGVGRTRRIDIRVASK